MKIVLRLIVFLGILSQGYSQALDWNQFSPVISATGTAPKIGVDANGNAHAVWFDDSNTDVRASFWDGSSWSVPETIFSGADTLLTIELGVEADGNALAIWSSTTAPGIVLANAYTSGMGWGSAVDLNTGVQAWPGANTIPQVAVDNEGSALVLWRIRQGSSAVGLWRKYSFSGGTYTPAPGLSANTVGESPNLDANFIKIGVYFDGLMKGVVVWANDATNTVQGATWEGDTGFGTWTSQTDLSGALTAPRPALAINPADTAGRAIAIWNDSSASDIKYSHLTNPGGNSWSAAASIPGSTAPTSTASPAIAQDSSSNALAVWISFDGADGTIYASFYDRMMGSWSMAEAISSAASDVANPQVAYRLDGTALVAWEQGGTIRSRIRSSTGEWFPDTGSSPDEISGTGASTPRVSIQGISEGVFIAVWEGSVEGALGIESSGTVTAQGYQQLDCPGGTTVTNTLVWTPSIDPSTISVFRIYRGDLMTQIAEVSGSTRRYEDSERPAGAQTYFIASVVSGVESDATQVDVAAL